MKFKQLNINNMKKSLFLKSSILLMFLFCGVFGLNAQSVLFSEDFSGFVDSSSTDVSSTLDNYTTLSGWSGSKVYQCSGKVKLGTASALGWLQTPAIDLSANGGNFTLEFDAVAWYHDSTTIIVSLDNTSYEVTGLENNGNYGSYGHFTLSLTGGTSNSHIKFEGKQSAKARFFMDNIIITQSGGVPTVATPTIIVSGDEQSANTYFGPVTVTLSASDGASIYYTLDGTEPTSASTLYTAPFVISETSTLKAIAISGDNSSSVVTRTITILNMTPIFFEDFELNGLNEMTVTNVSGAYEWVTATHSGNTYAYANAYGQGATETWLITPAITPLTAGGVMLSFKTAKNYNGPALQVKYSTDYSGLGSPATATWTDITSDCAFSSGSWAWTNSGDVEIEGALPLYFAWVYTSEESSAAAWELDNILVLAENPVTPEVAAPVFTPVAGNYADSVTFSLACATEGAEIRYTTDGTEPTETSLLYSAPITLTATTTVKAKAFKANWLASETVTAVYTIVYEPILSVTPSMLNFNSTQLTQTFTVSGAYLSDPVTMTCSDLHFTVNPSTISDPNTTTEVTVTFDGTEPATGTVTIVSGILSEQIVLIATAQVAAPVLTPATETSDDAITVAMSCTAADAAIHYTTDGTEPTENSAVYTLPLVFNTPGTYTVKALATKAGWENSEVTTGIYTINAPVSNDTIVYSVGFEDAEGFTASNVYNNTTVAFTGADGAQWGTYYGTPSTNNHIAGAQSMQMRWYTSAPENIGYTFTNFDLNNVTHVTFAAASSNGLNVRVSHSADGGNTYSAGQVFMLGSSAQVFDYVVDEEGSYNFVRLKFAIELPDDAPTATSRVVIDSLVVFGVPGQTPSVVATPVISPNDGFYYEPQTVSITCADADAVIRYTTDGTEPTETSTVYSQSFIVNTTTTIMAKAWKTNMTPSFTATATISFPAQVANIAAFKAAASNDPQQIMSDVTFVFRSGRYMFVEDNTAAMLIYDNSTPVITNTYNEGDVIQAGVFGKYTMYQGMVEMVPTHNALEATGTPVTVTPANATITDIKTQYTDVYESKLVRLSDVTFISATQFVQNGDTMAIYNRFNTVTTEISAGDLVDVTGFVSYSTNYGYQIYPRGDEDIDIHPVVIMDTVATPVFDLFKDGEFYRANIICATEGATIYYTLDGTDPDESSNLFTDLFPLPLTVHYTLKAIAMKEGMVNSAIAVYDYNPSDINSYELRDNLNVYPNPATDVVFIDTKDDKAMIERVELFNAFGQLIRSVEVGNAKAEISVSELATGTYFVKLFTDKGDATLPVIRK